MRNAFKTAPPCFQRQAYFDFDFDLLYSSPSLYTCTMNNIKFSVVDISTVGIIVPAPERSALETCRR